MAYFESSFSDSPVLAISPQTAHQALALGVNTYPPESSSMNAMSRSCQGANSAASQRPSGAGRKRSRDEAEPNLCDDDVPEPAPIEETEEGWIYGPGMILIKPGDHYVTDASSMSGTWVEERAAAEEDARKSALQRQPDNRPCLRSNKSQRLEQTLASSPGKEFSIPSPSTSVSNIDQGPVVDDFTVHLGIGWRRISDDEHIQAAARGWAKYIENHYPISNATIRLESKGLQSYLVEAAEGYFLFDENLRQGRLVSTTGQGALDNLKTNPPTFDGAETMMAGESPRTLESQSIANTPIFPLDVEMEVC